MVGAIQIEGARIGFKNFSGVEGPYNKAGERSFAVFLDHELADELASDGWNVKYPKRIEDQNPDEDNRLPYLSVDVSYNRKPELSGLNPKVVLVSNNNVSRLEEPDLDMLDWVNISNVDVIIRPYSWTVNGNHGIKAYCKSIYITIDTDSFMDKYGI